MKKEDLLAEFFHCQYLVYFVFDREVLPADMANCGQLSTRLYLCGDTNLMGTSDYWNFLRSSY